MSATANIAQNGEKGKLAGAMQIKSETNEGSAVIPLINKDGDPPAGPGDRQ